MFSMFSRTEPVAMFKFQNMRMNQLASCGFTIGNSSLRQVSNIFMEYPIEIFGSVYAHFLILCWRRRALFELTRAAIIRKFFRVLEEC